MNLLVLACMAGLQFSVYLRALCDSVVKENTAKHDQTRRVVLKSGHLPYPRVSKVIPDFF